MAEGAIEVGLVKTPYDRKASLLVSSHNNVITLRVISDSPSESNPSIELDIATNGSFYVYKDTGSGWSQVRSL